MNNFGKVYKVLILASSDFPREIQEIFLSEFKWRVHNDTAIILNAGWLSTEESNFDKWLVDNFDLSEVNKIFVDVTW